MESFKAAFSLAVTAEEFIASANFSSSTAGSNDLKSLKRDIVIKISSISSRSRWHFFLLTTTA